MAEKQVPLNTPGTHVLIDGKWRKLDYGFCAGGWVDDDGGHPAPPDFVGERLVTLHESGTFVLIEGRGGVPIRD